MFHNVIPFKSPPLVVTQPTNQITTVGSNVTFIVSTSGSMSLSYQWECNTTNILNATNATLLLTNVQLSQAGTYFVLVTNLAGSALSSNATLIVLDALDHFAWNQISSPRFVNAPFTVTLEALDAANGIFTNFNGNVALGSTNGIAVAPSISANFIQGSWTGLLTVSQPATNLVLTANDGLGHGGLANPINIVSPPILGEAQSSGFVLLFWPVASSDFVLESSPTLSPANWVPVPASPLQIGNQYLESIQVTSTNSFFHLRFTGQ
jgi:hypothetical protein